MLHTSVRDMCCSYFIPLYEHRFFPLTLKLVQAGKMSVCVKGIDFAFFYHYSVGFWSRSDNVVVWGFHFIVKNEHIVCKLVMS